MSKPGQWGEDDNDGTGGRTGGPRQRALAAQGRGRRGEKVAAWWLRLRGYRIIASNFRTRFGEIDLIARRGQTICFIEVKMRKLEADALYAISPAQRVRIEKTALAYIARHPELAEMDMRFDAFITTGGFRGYLLEDAWRPEW